MSQTGRPLSIFFNSSGPGAGIAGALLTRALFELAVIVLSSLLGAALVLQATGSDFDYSLAVFLATAVIGVVYQLVGSRGRRRRKTTKG